MLTGRRPFAGEETSVTLASVLRDEPDWQSLPEAARPLASVLRRLLEKDPARRLRDMGDVKLLLTDAEAHVGRPVSVAPRSRRWWIVGAAALGVAAGLVSAVVVMSWRRSPTPVSRVERFPLQSAATPPSTEPPGRNVAISPDGSHIVYTTGTPPGNQLVVRPLDRLEGTVIGSADRARDPFFSDDGRQVGYATVDELRRVSVEGGPGVRICGLSSVFRGGSWGPDGSIVFAQAGGLGLFRVPETGGEAQLIVAPDLSKDELNYLRPLVLPDGRSVLYTVALRGGRTRIVARRFAGGTRSQSSNQGSARCIWRPDICCNAHDQRLMAVAFDPVALRRTGSPVPVQEDVSIKLLSGVANVAAASDGSRRLCPRRREPGVAAHRMGRLPRRADTCARTGAREPTVSSDFSRRRAPGDHGRRRLRGTDLGARSHWHRQTCRAVDVRQSQPLSDLGLPTASESCSAPAPAPIL